MVEREDDAVFDSELKEEERGGHCVAEEKRVGRADDIGMEGMSFIFDKAASWTSRWRECDSDEPVSGVTLYGTVNLVRMTT
jgi:hypothetical protein